MPAIPAWPTKSLPRLFVRTELAEGGSVALDAGPANYLGNVLRLSPGAEVLLFDGISGEWLGRIVEAGKKRMTLMVVAQTRPIEEVPDVILAFAPVKRAQTDWLVEKATELGVARLQPVMTRRTIAERVRLDRLQGISVEAAEQCGRTRLPTIAEPMALPAFLAALDRRLYFADETGGAAVAGAMVAGAKVVGPAALLIGPEGGFTPEEREQVRAHPRTIAISLGPRILRAETAALAALATFMALAGDWR